MLLKHLDNYLFLYWISVSVADPEEEPGGPVPPLFLDQTEARSPPPHRRGRFQVQTEIAYFLLINH